MSALKNPMMSWHYLKIKLDRVIAIHKNFSQVAKRAKYILPQSSANKIEKDIAKQFAKIEKGKKMIAEGEEGIGTIILKKSEAVSDTEQVLKSLAKSYHPDIYKKIWRKK